MPFISGITTVHKERNCSMKAGIYHDGYVNKLLEEFKKNDLKLEGETLKKFEAHSKPRSPIVICTYYY